MKGGNESDNYVYISFLVILSPVVIILQVLLFSVVLCLYHVIVLFELTSM